MLVRLATTKPPSTSLPSATSIGCWSRWATVRAQHVAEHHDLGVGVRDLDADRALARDGAEDADLGALHRVGDVAGQVGDPLDLDARAERHLVAGDRRAAVEAGDRAVDVELGEHLLQRGDDLVVGLGVLQVRAALGQRRPGSAACTCRRRRPARAGSAGRSAAGRARRPSAVRGLRGLGGSLVGRRRRSPAASRRRRRSSGRGRRPGRPRRRPAAGAGVAARRRRSSSTTSSVRSRAAAGRPGRADVVDQRADRRGGDDEDAEDADDGQQRHGEGRGQPARTAAPPTACRRRRRRARGRARRAASRPRCRAARAPTTRERERADQHAAARLGLGRLAQHVRAGREQHERDEQRAVADQRRGSARVDPRARPGRRRGTRPP